jgi:hypothetical protein
LSCICSYIEDIVFSYFAKPEEISFIRSLLSIIFSPQCFDDDYTLPPNNDWFISKENPLSSYNTLFTKIPMFPSHVSVGFNPINSKLFLEIRMSISIIKYLPKYYPPSKSINQSYVLSIIDLLEAVVPSLIQNFDYKLKESMTKK